MRLLCVEDETALREDIAEYLRMKSYEVDEASSGAEAMDQLSRNRYDLVLCDIKMPQMDGYEVLKQVRSEQQFVTTPFVFLTALSDNDDKVRALNGGCDAFLTKPIDFSVLDAALRAQIERQQVRDFAYRNRLHSTRSHAMAALDDALSGPMAEVSLIIQHLRDTLPILEPSELDGYLANIQEKSGKHALDMYTLHNALQLETSQAKAQCKPVSFEALVKGAVGEHHYNSLAASQRVSSGHTVSSTKLHVDIALMQRAIAELLAAMPLQAKEHESIACQLKGENCLLTVADDEAMTIDEDFDPVDESTNLPSLSKVTRQRLVAIMYAVQVANAHGGRIELKLWPEGRLAVRFVLPQPKA